MPQQRCHSFLSSEMSLAQHLAYLDKLWPALSFAKLGSICHTKRREMTKQQPYILVADDDPEDQEMLAEQFRRRNPDVEVKCLADGYQVLDYLRVCPTENLPEGMVVDYKMPGITGAEVFQTLQHEERYRKIPKVIWSTSNNQEYIDQSLNSGADKFFTKPVDMRTFDKMVDFLSHLFKVGRQGIGFTDFNPLVLLIFFLTMSR
jgi:CheY-like chemotaxis protein